MYVYICLLVCVGVHVYACMHMHVCAYCAPTSLIYVLRMGTKPATVLKLSTNGSFTFSMQCVWDGHGSRENERMKKSDDKIYGAI